METISSPRTEERSGPSGRACANCVRAKAKCVEGQDLGGKCGRCSRLKKDCALPAPTVRKRKLLKRTRVAEMEAKIDGLVTLLKSTQNPSLNNELLAFAPDVNPTKPPHAPPTPSSPDHVSRATPSAQPEDREVRSPWLPAVIQDSSGSISQLNTNTHSVHETQPSFGIRPTPEEAEVLLSRFRQMVAYFPLILLPESTNARDLLQERPFLYQCIMAVSCPNLSQQIAFGDEMMRYLGEHILVKGKKSLDLLLGILTYAGWHHFNGPFPSHLCVLLQLANSLVFNLELNKPRRSKSKHQLFEHAILNPCDPMKNSFDGLPVENEAHTLEEQRALIACFFLSSVISTYFQRMDPLRLTPYLEDCIRNLSEHAECQSDIVLTSLARLQIIVGQIPPYPGANPSTTSAPVGLYVKALQTRLKGVRTDPTRDPDQNAVLLMHYHNVEMSVCELGISIPTSLASGNHHDFHQLETLHTCLRAVQAVLEIFLSQPAYVGRRLSFFTYTQIAHTLVVMHRLSTFESKDWDLGYVRETVNFGRILDRLICWFKKVLTAEELEGSNLDVEGVFSRTVRKFSLLRAWYDQKMALGSLTAEASSTVMDVDVALNGASMDFFDEVWLEQMLGPWDDQYNPELP